MVRLVTILEFKRGASIRSFLRYRAEAPPPKTGGSERMKRKERKQREEGDRDRNIFLEGFGLRFPSSL